MAGIGFKLRNMIDRKHGLIHSVKSYGYAVIVLNGPMFMCIVAVFIIQLILGTSKYSGIPSERILTTVTYSFILSTILTSIYSMVLTRYVSDCLHKKEFQKIMPSLYGAMVFAVILSIAASISLILFAGMKYQYGIMLSILYSIVSIISLETIYLSAVKNYKSISLGFLAGNILIVLMLLFIKQVPPQFSLNYILLSFDSGFALTAIILIYQIRKAFGEGNGNFMEWTRYIIKYPSLITIGFCYTFSLYFLSLFYRFTDTGSFINGFLTVKTGFDLPFYLAVLGFIPGLVYFSIRFETSLHTSCNAFYLSINNNGTLDEIDYNLYSLKVTVKYCYIKLALIQTIITLIMLSLPLIICKNIETGFPSYYTFCILTLGMNSSLLMYVSMIVILYFDARNFAFLISLIYLALNALLTIITYLVHLNLICIGFMTASILSLIISIVFLVIFFKNIKKYAFMMFPNLD
ncbi:MAG: exopolysaccharide Pel transporter PelG [Bacillota bacterium]|nr:exopolysaccharide Pel transporter PelG [Bacillota bacterium]